jgi:hypothetical protein
MNKFYNVFTVSSGESYKYAHILYVPGTVVHVYDIQYIWPGPGFDDPSLGQYLPPPKWDKSDPSCTRFLSEKITCVGGSCDASLEWFY